MKHLKKWNIFESIKSESEYPTVDDLQEFFYDLTDYSSHSKCVIQSGWSYFTTDNISNRNANRSQLMGDIVHPDWINDECISLGEKWSDIFVDISKRDLSLRECTSLFRNHLSFGDKHDPNSNKLFSSHIEENILNGTIPACSIIELDLGYYKMNMMETLFECLDRLYLATGWRPIGKLWSEKYLTGDRIGDVVLRCEDLKLYNCTDIEYKNLCKIFPVGNHTRELIKRFI